jgi:hypothetical protein
VKKFVIRLKKIPMKQKLINLIPLFKPGIKNPLLIKKLVLLSLIFSTLQLNAGGLKDSA